MSSFSSSSGGPLPVVRIKNRRSSTSTVVLAVMLAMSLLVNVVALVQIQQLRQSLAEQPRSEDTAQVLEQERLTLQAPNPDTLATETLSVPDVYDSAIGSVVTIECGLSQGTGFSYSIQHPRGSGSVIVTNFHVVDTCIGSSRPLTVRGRDTPEAAGSVFSFDQNNDLALVLTQLVLPPLNTSSGARIGDTVVALGSPRGLEGTLTQGIVSNLTAQWYQTDAAINPGNSGGPLLDLRGHVLGVNTERDSNAEGIGFAFRISLLCENLVLCLRVEE